MPLFDRFISRLITHGEITLIGDAGRRRTFGVAGSGPSVAVRIHDRHFIRRLLRHPGLAIGEGYMDGAYSIESGTLRDFLEVLVVSTEGRDPGGSVGAALFRIANMIGRNDKKTASRNVQHHYDIGHQLYEMFLDKDLQYSCGYWRDGVESLDQAQIDKKHHIAAKLLLEPGMRVLDIGSGWGGLAITLAADYGAHVTGVTLSRDQYEISVRRAEDEGLDNRVTFKLLDYREEVGSYDRIVSVGMFEHVGRRSFGEFFEHLRRLLKPDGVALLHTISWTTGPRSINAWMKKYIFPGACLPSLSQLVPLVEGQRMWLTDLEVMRIHYSKTLAAWDERFQARQSEVAQMFDERFCRMWEFYLQLNEIAFKHGDVAVMQLQLAKRIDTVPISREYLYDDAARPSSRRSIQERA